MTSNTNQQKKITNFFVKIINDLSLPIPPNVLHNYKYDIPRIMREYVAFMEALDNWKPDGK